MRRRDLLMTGSALGLSALLGFARLPAARAEPALGNPTAFTPDSVVAMAQALAATDFVPPEDNLPAALADLDYLRYRAIEYRSGNDLWASVDTRFHAQFLPRGFLFRERVDLFQVANGQASPILYRNELFDAPEGVLDPQWPASLGFSGFRILYPINRPEAMDEVVVFQGASYFRAVGRGLGYGLSARGIAVNTAAPQGEEFPSFRAFWLERPAPGATAVTIHALLDSPSLTGAYTFTTTPGDDTVMDVAATLFFRRPVSPLGLAPLTSMFLFGPNDRAATDDYRAAVHDSQGLSMANGSGEWLWRPLTNPTALQVSSFIDESPRGFGLLQRNRDFRDYQDLGAHYERRPSAWVEPVGDWGRGAVVLIEIPTAAEYHDNIVAFWQPEQPVEAGTQLTLGYRLHWCSSPPQRAGGAEILATRSGLIPDQSSRRLFTLDFGGPALDALPADAALTLDVTSTAGTVSGPTVLRSPETGGWRGTFELAVEGAALIEMRAVLRQGDAALSETWLYRWTP